MNSLQNKLYNQEVTPPENTWKNIAAALDNPESKTEFSFLLYNIEINPPVNTWEKIISRLDKNQVKNEFQLRLNNMEIVPPAPVWEKISALLDSKNVFAQTQVRKIRPFFRYAAAAIFLGAVAFGIIKITEDKEQPHNTVAKENINKDSSLSENNNNNNPLAAQIPEASSGKDYAITITKNKPVYASMDRPEKSIIRAIRSSMVTNINEIVSENDLSQSIYAYADHIPNIADRYVMLMTPDGNIIRMSKKWSDLLCCVSGVEQDADCKNQLKKWQEKIATSSLAPSPGNFMDILGLVNSLNENNEL
ncbi:MAG: hypothetical protein ACSLE0_16105 [Chitinophagaceae bacterium]